jgi:4-hydroxy-3-polyprenylbenzoate decarboxylase
MAYKGLADFLEELAGNGQLTRIDAEVDPHLEIAEITRRVAAVGGPALLFQRVRGQSIAVLTNLMGTSHRACRALGIESLDGIAERIEAVAAQHTPQNWFDRLKMSGPESGADKFRPKPVKNAASQQVVHLGRDVNLAAFPLVRSWPEESGASLTAGLLLSSDRQTPALGVTHCPLVAIDANRLAVIDDGNSAFARHWAAYQSAGERMPVAAVLGGDPAAILAAQFLLPKELEVLHLVGMLRGKPLEVAKCRTHDLLVPADAELILEGYLDPQSPLENVRAAGAGGSHYRVPCGAPVLQVSAVTHRNRPIFPAVIDSGASGEGAILAKARERMLLATVRSIAPDLTDVSLPLLGGPHRFAFVAIRKTFEYQARQTAAALWGSEALKFTKFVVLVDAGIDVHDPAQVWSRVGANVAPEKDVFFHDGPAHPADHAGTMFPLARHMAIDATAKLPGERPGPWPAPLDASEEIGRQVTARWAEFKLESGPPAGH